MTSNVTELVEDGRGGPASVAVRAGAYGEVVRRYAWLVSGSIYYAAAQWVVLALLARMLGAESVGRYAYGLALTGPVYMFANMQLGQVFASDAGHRYEARDYAGARIVTVAGALLVCLGLTLWSIGDHIAAAVVAIVAVAKGLESLGDVTFGGAQRSGLVHRIAYSGMLRGTLMLVLVAVAAVAVRNVILVVAMIATANLLVLPFDLGTLRTVVARESEGPGESGHALWRFDTGRIRGMLGLALPLGIVAVAVNLIGTIPRIALKEVAGLAELGRFAVLSYFVVGARMLVVPMSNAFVPALGAAFVAGRKRHFAEMTGALLALALLLGVAGWLGARQFGHWLLQLLYGSGYAHLAPQLATLMIGAGLSYAATFCEDALTSLRALRPKALLVVLVAAATLVAGGPLIRIRGFDGAVLTVVLANGLEALGSFALLVRALRRPWR